MKSLFASVLLLLLISPAFSQNTEGTIHYTETIQLDINLDELKNLPEEMKAQIPTEQSSQNVLTFHPEASLYTNSPEETEQDISYQDGDSDIDFEIKMEVPESAYFYNIKNRSSIESRELFGKKFLIGETKPEKWKITKETKEILGYTCTKATTTSSEDGETVEAWFTNAIPVEVGPSSFHGLPGAILSVRMKDGTYKIDATKVEFKKVDRKEIVAPKKGKKVTAAQFKEIVEQKQKEMADEYGGDGNIIIQTETIER